MSPRNVIFARLHYAIHHPDTGSYGPVLSSKASNNTKATAMMLNDGILQVVMPNIKGGGVTAVQVPLTGVMNLVFDAEVAQVYEIKGNVKAAK